LPKNKDRSLADRIVNILENWSFQNPYLGSINWTSGIEVGIRSLNLCVTISLLNSQGFLSTDKLKKIRKILYLHFRYLHKHPSLYSSANNHYVAELAGLIFLTHNLSFRHSEKYKILYLNKLISQIGMQFHNDGVNREQSTHYHALSINLILLSLIVAGHKADKLTEKNYNTLKKAVDFLSALKVNGDLYFELGDNDESHTIYDPYNPANFYDETVALGRHFLNQAYYFKCHTLLFSLLKIKCKSHVFKEVFKEFFFKDGGYYIRKDRK
jgi:hypothetical protein